MLCICGRVNQTPQLYLMDYENLIEGLKKHNLINNNKKSMTSVIDDFLSRMAFHDDKV